MSAECEGVCLEVKRPRRNWSSRMVVNLTRLRQWWLQRREADALRRLPPEMLKDIGLSTSEIDWAVRYGDARRRRFQPWD